MTDKEKTEADEPSAEEWQAWNHRFASEMLGEAWDLMTRPERTASEDRRMLSRALGALAHHESADGEQEQAIACWLVSRVYAALGEGRQAVTWAEEALRHGTSDGVDRCCEANALEALARGLAVVGGLEASRAFITRARDMYDELDEGTRGVLERELADIECRLATDRP